MSQEQIEKLKNKLIGKLKTDSHKKNISDGKGGKNKRNNIEKIIL
jgi:hypothetical protein